MKRADDILSDFCLCSDSRLFVSSGSVPPLSLLLFEGKRLLDTSTVSLGLESFSSGGRYPGFLIE